MKQISILRVISLVSTHCQNNQDFYSIIPDICLALTTAHANKIHIALAIILAWTSGIQICDVIVDVFFTIVGCDAAKNYVL